MVTRLLAAGMALVLCGCAAGPAVLRVTYDSTPRAADVSEGQKFFGKTPVAVDYVASPQFVAGGCMRLNPVTLHWDSGAMTAPTEHTVCAAQSYYQYIRLQRPDVPGLERDVAFANYVEAANDVAAMQRASEAQAIGAALGRAIGCAAAGSCGTTATDRTIAPAATPPASVQVNSCTNNVQCGIGMTCVKQPGQLSGFCAKPVNQFGVPTNTANPQFIQCRFTTDCAYGFRCEKQSPSSIYGACVK